jgi:hypothetical protein
MQSLINTFSYKAYKIIFELYKKTTAIPDI